MIWRAILASEFWPGATARGLLPGLRQSGWLVEEVDERLYLGAHDDLLGRLEARLTRSARKQALSRAILEAAEHHHSDIFLAVRGANVSPATLKALRDRGVFTINYFPDVRLPLDDLDYDLIVTTKSYHLEPLRSRLPEERIAFVDHGYSAEVHRPVETPGGEQPIDVLYAGNASEHKAKLLIALADALPDLRMRVVGSHWHRFTRGTRLEQAISGSVAIGDYYALEISRAKITLGFHYGPAGTHGFEDLVSTRTFEIPACGGFMLHVDNPEVRSLYDVPGEIDTFASVEELVEKVRYYLAHDEERRAIAARGHARAVPAYSYTERAKEIARIVEECLR